MKKMTLALSLCLLVALSFAQQAAKTKDQEQSNAEKFSERAGSLIQKEFIDIGNLKKCDLLIETHDFLDLSISGDLLRLFDNTHHIQIIKSIDDTILFTT